MAEALGVPDGVSLGVVAFGVPLGVPRRLASGEVIGLRACCMEDSSRRGAASDSASQLWLRRRPSLWSGLGAILFNLQGGPPRREYCCGDRPPTWAEQPFDQSTLRVPTILPVSTQTAAITRSFKPS